MRQYRLCTINENNEKCVFDPPKCELQSILDFKKIWVNANERKLQNNEEPMFRDIFIEVRDISKWESIR